MRPTAISLASVILVAACGGPPQDPATIAADQAALAPDTAQARLWRESGGSGAAAGVPAVPLAERGAVRGRASVRVPERAAQAAERPFPPTLGTGVVMLVVPQMEGAFTGTGRVQAASGEFLTLDLGAGRTLRVQVKVGGGPLQSRPGDSVRVYLRTSGDPLARNDVFALRLAQDEVVYALVGGSRPVAFRVPEPPLEVEQMGPPAGNTMAVAVRIGSERRTLKPGAEAQFPGAGLTVRVLASTAIQGEAAHAVEGDPYRVELVAWRSRRQ